MILSASLGQIFCIFSYEFICAYPGGVVEQGQSVDVLQTSSQEENRSEKVQTKNSSQEWIKLPLLQVGDQIIDVLTKIQGVVVGVEGERVIFHCREFGRVCRERELVVKFP